MENLLKILFYLTGGQASLLKVVLWIRTGTGPYLIKDVVPALWRVAGNVAEGPDGLLLHVLLLGEQQAHKDGDGSRLDNAARLLARPGGDVGERPGSLELLLTAAGCLSPSCPNSVVLIPIQI